MSACTFSDNLVHPCERLSKATEYGNPRGKQKGLWEWRLYKVDMLQTDDGMEKPSTVRFGVKSGEFVQKGVIFAFCPFCGTRIDGNATGAQP